MSALGHKLTHAPRQMSPDHSSSVMPAL